MLPSTTSTRLSAIATLTHCNTHFLAIYIYIYLSQVDPLGHRTPRPSHTQYVEPRLASYCTNTAAPRQSHPPRRTTPIAPSLLHHPLSHHPLHHHHCSMVVTPRSLHHDRHTMIVAPWSSYRGRCTTVVAPWSLHHDRPTRHCNTRITQPSQHDRYKH